MAKHTYHPHPNPTQYKIEQVSLLILLGLMIIAAALLMLTALLIGLPLFFIMAVMILLLIAPVAMRFVVTAPLTISADGLRVQPLFLPPQTIIWGQIHDLRAYPLLPAAHQEVGRKALIGRKRYQAAEGKMLIVTGLPWIYRIAGIFAGADARPIIAITNRTHADYQQLIARIEQALAR
jgi:hypothetical protein